MPAIWSRTCATTRTSTGSSPKPSGWRLPHFARGWGSEMADRARQRILTFLSSGPAVARDAANAGKVLLDAGERGTVAVDAAVLAAMAKEGVLVRKGARLSVAPEDIRTAFRGRTDRSRFQDQHRDLEMRQVDAGGEPGLAMVNLSESPIGQLMRRRENGREQV